MRKLFACFVMLFVGTLTLRAQVANNTSLVGTVVDSSGGVVVGAQVTGVNVATRVSYSGMTNAQGYYSIQFIAPGTYDITVTQSGFEKAVTSGVLVQTNQAVRTNMTL
ncbi:MAG: carboxypeptidase-like regulatory domain-containing protein, partial [Acidobacteriaceae bacterium]